ncbi:GNAT family N-acetyltransferase [Roseburia hominis]
MVYLLEEPRRAEKLFEGWEESLIWSCLQGVMGELYVDDRERPSAVMAILGDFSFFAGEPCEELVRYKPKWCSQDFMIMVPQNEKWGELILSCYKEKAKAVTRYAIKKEPGIFDREKLQQIAESVPEGFKVKLIDEEVYNWSRGREWCKDWASHYDTYEEFRKMGLGVVVTKDGVPVAGASSYSTYRGGIEVEINTKEEYRRRSLASVCGARLILECMKRNLYPSWDAQNKWSVGLAEKLGYHFSHEYPAYEIWGY